MNTDYLEIKYLCDHPAFAPVVSGWIYTEFIKDVRDDLSLEDLTARIASCGKDTLPIRLIAILNGACVGTASLVANDLKCRNYTPWLAALIVDKTFRGNGIGQALIDHVKPLARQLGYEELYLRTEHASGYYRQLGWQYVETCDDAYGLKPDVFKISL